MSEYNIQMNKYNALNAGYDQLFPATKIANVDGLGTALQNNDPRQWGLGPTAKKPVDNDFNNIDANGFFHAIGNNPGGGWYDAVCIKNPDDVRFQIAIQPSTNYMALRQFYNYSWQPWEWLNPPMILGVEYRTTERYQGKPVYAKRIHCESMPSGAGYIDILPSTTEVPNALISTAYVIRCYGKASVQATIPFYSSPNDFMQVGSVSNNVIRFYTAKAYGGTADITVYYTKTTD